MSLCIEAFDSPKFLWIAFGGTRADKTDDLIAFDFRGLVDRVGVEPLELQVELGLDDETGSPM